MVKGRDVRPAIVLALLLPTACGGGGAPQRTVFDATGQTANLVAVGSTDLEHADPAFDREASPGSPPWTGVSILKDGVRLSRPSRWMIRDASNDPGHAYIRYVSPRAYSFAIYELSDSSSDSWKDILQRYEVDVAAAGAKMVGQRIPVATRFDQGRAYTVERKIESTLSRSREIVLRGHRRVVLVQVVAEGDGLSRVSDELVEVFKGLEVL